jgi:hypothetical protein
MELTPGQQRLLFVVIVIALAGLGIFLLSSRHHQATAAPAPSSTTAPSPTTASSTTEAVSASASASPSVPPSTVPPASPPATTAGGANIYEWLPFSQADLTAAAKTTLAFTSDYTNWSYTDTKTAYAAKLAGVTTPQEAATLAYDFSTAGVAGPRSADKQVSTGSGTIESISSFGTGPTSITFSVTIAEKLASTTGTKTSTATYAITSVSTGTGWQVSNIELSGIGNQ